MKIAATFENGQIFQHFGRTEQFKVYNVEDGKILSSEVVGTGGEGHGALAGVLRSLGVDVLLCGGIGAGAQNALKESGIQFYGGVQGNVDRAVESYIAGKLVYDPNVHCDHHGHGEAQPCSSHGCHH